MPVEALLDSVVLGRTMVGNDDVGRLVLGDVGIQAFDDHEGDHSRRSLGPT